MEARNLIHYDKIDLSSPDILGRLPYKHRRTPIVCTIADPNITPVDIQKMMEAGMNSIRFKATHCTTGEKVVLLSKVDKAAAFLCKKYAILDWPISTCLELKTCIVRTGLLEGVESVSNDLLAEQNNTPLTHCIVCVRVSPLCEVLLIAADIIYKSAMHRKDHVYSKGCEALKSHLSPYNITHLVEKVILKEGTNVMITYYLEEFDKCTAKRIFVDNPYIAVDVKVGMMISINQDAILMRCIKIVDDKAIQCVVTKTGRLGNFSLVFIRGKKSERSIITKKDLEIIKFAIEYRVEMLLINYVRKVETLHKVKEFMGKNIKKRPILLGGLCTLEGLGNLDAIIKEADGIVLSREFLAYEMEASARYRMLAIQKWVGAKCQQAGKPFFISGEVFEGALSRGEFYHNETADVTNAIIDGASGFMLKDSLNVDYVLEVIKALNSLCCTVEPVTNTKEDFRRILEGILMPTNAAEACAIACTALAHQTKAKVIIVPTVTGQTVKILLKLRPASFVITVSSKQFTTRRLQSYRCVYPLMYRDDPSIYKNWESAVSARVDFAIEYAVKLGWLEYGNSYVTLQRGSEQSAFCDMVRAWNVTIYKKAMVECPDGETETKTPGPKTLA